MSIQGFGKNVPPDKSQVIIYFLEKGLDEKKANDFFSEYTLKEWKNRRGLPIRNWKVHAWEHIWSKK